MRIVFSIIIFVLVGCQSETGIRSLEVSTQVEIKLPPDAIYGNISSFSGFHAAVPDLFVDEQLEEESGALIRRLSLSNHTTIVDELIETKDDSRIVNYTTVTTTLPVEEMTHSIQVKEITSQQCKVIWISKINVQNRYRDQIYENIKGIQEAYLFSVQLLGEELDQLLNDPNI